MPVETKPNLEETTNHTESLVTQTADDTTETNKAKPGAVQPSHSRAIIVIAVVVLLGILAIALLWYSKSASKIGDGNESFPTSQNLMESVPTSQNAFDSAKDSKGYSFSQKTPLIESLSIQKDFGDDPSTDMRHIDKTWQRYENPDRKISFWYPNFVKITQLNPDVLELSVAEDPDGHTISLVTIGGLKTDTDLFEAYRSLDDFDDAHKDCILPQSKKTPTNQSNVYSLSYEYPKDKDWERLGCGGFIGGIVRIFFDSETGTLAKWYLGNGGTLYPKGVDDLNNFINYDWLIAESLRFLR